MSHVTVGTIVILFGCCLADNNPNIKYFIENLEELVKQMKEQEAVIAGQKNVIADLSNSLGNDEAISGQHSSNDINFLTARLAIADENEQNLNSLNTTLVDQIETMDNYKTKLEALNGSIEEQKRRIEEITNQLPALNQSRSKTQTNSHSILPTYSKVCFQLFRPVLPE